MARAIRLLMILMILMLLAGNGVVLTATRARAQNTPPGGQPIARPTPVPDVPSVGPDIYSTRPPPGVQRTAPTSPPVQYTPPANVGPTTGYGPGGMAPVPGAPANPPYSFGGTSGPPR